VAAAGRGGKTAGIVPVDGRESAAGAVDDTTLTVTSFAKAAVVDEMAAAVAVCATQHL
jgi:hypothetical protein